MKKFFTYLLCAAFSTTAMNVVANDYTGTLTVTVNGEETVVNDVAISIDKSGSNCSLSLNNFSLGEGMDVGNIVLDNVTTAEANGVNVLAVSRDINITEGDKEGVVMWIGPMLGPVPVNMLARFTDNALVTNIDIDMMDVLGQAINVQFESDGYADYAKTFQIPNSDFETWSDDSSITEPRHWHGFKSATGTYASMASSTLLKSEDVRAGATGHSAVIASKKVIGNTIANGTMTNGQLKAQSMTAANTWNHSEMDQASTATDKYGDRFYTALVAKPDAIKTWLKFAQGTTNSSYPYATLSAVIFNGEYYQDPEPKVGESSALIGGTKYTQADADNVAARVVAKASNTEISTCDWSEKVIPFNYENYPNENANAILVTISTNATPGKGSDNDQVWVDDMELVYNATITNIALNNLTLEGFTFDAATKMYAIEYEGDAKTVTADNFVATIEGMSAIEVKNVEDLGNGNYKVAIGVTSPDFKNADLYTINIKHNVPSTILGDVDMNGKVEVADINIAINIILNKGVTLADYPNADVDGNGTVEVADINMIINELLKSN